MPTAFQLLLALITKQTENDQDNSANEPTQENAQDAIQALLEVFVDFPFQHECHRTAAVAAILSLVGRYAIKGSVPLFAVSATTRGSGKGLLVDTISIIATGRTAPRRLRPPGAVRPRWRV